MFTIPTVAIEIGNDNVRRTESWLEVSSLHSWSKMSKSEVIKQVMGEIKHMVKRLSERNVVIVKKSME